MNVLYNFLPFVFTSTSSRGKYVEGLPLCTPGLDTLTTHGRLFGVLEITFPDVLQLEGIGKQVFPYFEELYYKNPTISVHEHLISCMRETQVWIEKQLREYGSMGGLDYSLCMGVVWGGAMYAVRSGSLVLRLYRDDTFGMIFDTDNVGSIATSVSGYIESGDTIVLYNSVIDGNLFPVSLKNVFVVDDQVKYNKLSELFGDPIESVVSGCVLGFLIDGEQVPSPEEDALVMGEMVDGEVFIPPAYSEEAELIEKEIIADELHLRDKKVINENVFLTLTSKIKKPKFLEGFHPRKTLSFFTRKRVFVMGCMFLLLFVGLVITGKDFEKKYSNNQKIEEAKKVTIPKIKEMYTQGLYYADLNPERAKNYLNDAKRSLDGLDSIIAADSDVQKLKEDVRIAYGVVTKVFDLSTLSPYFDMSVLSTKVVGKKIAINKDYLIVSDVTNSVVYKIGILNKSGVPLIGPTDLESLVSAEGDGAVVYGVSRRGIAKVKENESNVKHPLEGQSSWGTLTDVQVFGGSVYVLDSGNNQIWKHIPEGEGFSTVRNYVSSDSVVDFTDASSFAIDGSVWVAKKSGEVLKFSSGKPDSFFLSTIDDPIIELSAIYTDEKTEYLYLLDKIGGRVVVMNKKDGMYVATYKSSSFVGAEDLAVDTTAKQLFVLTSQKIFKTEIKEEPKAAQ